MTEWKRLREHPDDEQAREILDPGDMTRIVAVHAVRKGFVNALPVKELGWFQRKNNGEIRFVSNSGLIQSGTLKNLCTRYRVWYCHVPAFDGV